MPSIRPVTRPITSARPLTQRSRVTNGRQLFVEGGDGRGSWARRFRDVVEQHVSDCGGSDACSYAEQSIIRRIAALTVELERIEAKFATGDGDALLDSYQRAAGNLRRLLESIGLQRRARDVQTLDQYLAQNYRDEETGTGESEDDPAALLEATPETQASGLRRFDAEPSNAEDDSP